MISEKAKEMLAKALMEGRTPIVFNNGNAELIIYSNLEDVFTAIEGKWFNGTYVFAHGTVVERPRRVYEKDGKTWIEVYDDKFIIPDHIVKLPKEIVDYVLRGVKGQLENERNRLDSIEKNALEWAKLNFPQGASK